MKRQISNVKIIQFYGFVLIFLFFFDKTSSLQYLAAITGHPREFHLTKYQILQSNIILEAFGNAKTRFNDNSTRFVSFYFLFRGLYIRVHPRLEKKVAHSTEGPPFITDQPYVFIFFPNVTQNRKSANKNRAFLNFRVNFRGKIST